MVQLSDIYRGKNSDNKNCGFGWLFLSYTDVSKKANNRLKFVNQDIEGKTLIPAARRHTVKKKKRPGTVPNFNDGSASEQTEF